RKDAAVSPTMIGKSGPIRELHDLIGRVAGTDSTVLILGESGTGKELVARALHDQSDRKKAPFVAINSAAIADSLLESELFGYERGAFTGAVALKRGKLEVAQGGTVFLDEIGDLQPPLQAKLLRVLEQREFERVGGTKAIPLDIRFVAATHHDLPTAVAGGKFRQDLYHRLNVVPIHTPALRERPEDILPLARHFLEMTATANKRRAPGISRDAQKVLLAYGWPGNVRELRNAMERAVVLGRSELVELADLPPALSQAPVKGKGTYQGVLGDAKKDSILQAYRQAAGSYKGAAELLKLHPNYLLRLVRNLGLAEDVKKIQGRSGTT
ncbi:MAG: sigma-54 dependent transcriptional regulator, partial [Bryobacteraceae bacterium]